MVYKTLFRFFTRALELLHGPRYAMNIMRSPLGPPFLAGLFAGPTLLIDNVQPRRIAISTYALCKSLQFTYHALRKNRIIPRMRCWWGSWLLFPIAHSQLFYYYIIHPDIFPVSFNNLVEILIHLYTYQNLLKYVSAFH